MSSLPQTFYVYVLTRPHKGNPQGKVFYVGKGTAKRVYDHELEARRDHKCHKCNVIRKVWEQGGQIQRYIIFTTNNEDEAYAYEIETIALYGRANLTNKTDGGEGIRDLSADTIARRTAAIKATASTPEARAKRSAIQKAVWKDPAALARKAAAAKAQWADPEIRARKIAAYKAVQNTPEQRAKTSAASKAAWASPEYRAKQNVIHKGSIRSLEARAKMSVASKASHASPETRAKMSAARKASWARRKAKEHE